MRIIAQRAGHSFVTIGGETVGSIESGLVLLLGVGQGDTEEDLDYLVGKVANLRIFEDGDGKMNESLLDVGGEVLLVSQFTLYGDTRKGRRPSFIGAADPETAIRFYDLFAEKLRSLDLHVATGVFQADMEVHILNDGPVTIWLDTADR